MSLIKTFLAKFKSINTNLVIATSAVFISACALFISLQEVRIMRNQQKASMYPYLSFGTRYNSKGFGLALKNSGNGLARINSYTVSNDSIYFKDWLDLVEHLCPECDINYNILSTNGIQGEMITPGEEINLFFVQWTEDSRKLEQSIKNFKLEICYSSLLGDYWLTNDDGITSLDKPCKRIIEHQFEL